MNYSIIPVDKFKKEAKKLVKKYPSLINELRELSEILQTNPTTGTALGNKTYKIRLAIKSKGAGKSGGARVVTYVVKEDLEIYLLTIYDKADFETVEDSMLQKIIAEISSSK